MFDNLVPAEDEDNNDVILEVRAGITQYFLRPLVKSSFFKKTFCKFKVTLFNLGTGGQEACLFTMEMFQLYQKYVQF